MTEIKSLIRPEIVPPRPFYRHFLKSREKRLTCEALLDQIWRAFLKELERPIRQFHGGEYRIVEVLGCIRYHIHRETGALHSTVRHLPGYGKNCFTTPGGPFLVDLPPRLNTFVVETFLKSWDAEIFATGPGFTPREERKKDGVPGEEYRDQSDFYYAFYRAFLTAIRRSVYWKRLRYKVQVALKLDPQLVDIARRSVVQRKAPKLSNLQYNLVIKHRETYLQLNNDAAQLLWLYTLALQEGLRLPEGELLQALKSKALADGWGERGWRLVANHRLRDFEPAVGDGFSKWRYLNEYVQLHNTLDRSDPIPKRLAHLFNEPDWKLLHDGNINYRQVVLHPAVLNHLIDAAVEQRDINRFLREEVAVVLTWLGQVQPQLDRNQLRQGWAWLLNQAAAWQALEAAKVGLQPLSWDCKLKTTEIGGYRFIPLENAWRLRLEALQQRHCADRYISRCLAGTYRLFAVTDLMGKHKATAAYSFGTTWNLEQIKGFANRETPHGLKAIAESIAGGLEVLDEGRDERLASERAEESDEAQMEAPGGDPRPFRCGTHWLGRALANIENENRASAVDRVALEEEPDGPLCPFCGDTEGGCEHLIVSFDACGEGICGGEAYRDREDWVNAIVEVLVECVRKGFRSSGLGNGVDGLLRELFECGEDPLEFTDRNRFAIDQVICDLIYDLPGVITNSWDLDSMPGLSTTYTNYWAENPRGVIKQVESIFSSDGDSA